MGVPLYNYSRWDNFSKSELICSHTGLENPNIKAFTKVVDIVQALRDFHGVSIGIASGYRHDTHPIEAAKIAKGKSPGQHNRAALDIVVPSYLTWSTIGLLFDAGCTGIGTKLHGDRSKRFIHFDFRVGAAAFWSYP